LATAGRMKSREGERGVALLAALVVVALLVALVLPFNQKARVDVALAANVRDELKALYAAQSGLTMALAALRADESRDADGHGDQWAAFEAYSAGSASLFQEGCAFAGKIVDECGKLNINSLLSNKGKVSERGEARLKRLFDALGLGPEKLDAVLDWLDKDEEARPFGAETELYQEEGLGVSPTNGPLTSLGELLMVRGITAEDYTGSGERPGLRDVLTIETAGKVNLNTASQIVIACLSEKLDDGMAANLVASREGKNYTKLDEISSDVPGFSNEVIGDIEDMATLKSDTFRVEITGSCHEARKMISALVKRGETAVGPVSMRVM